MIRPGAHGLSVVGRIRTQAQCEVMLSVLPRRTAPNATGVRVLIMAGFYPDVPL